MWSRRFERAHEEDLSGERARKGDERRTGDMKSTKWSLKRTTLMIHLGCQAMKRLFALLRRIITLTTLAEALSAAAVYSAFWIAITALGLKAIYIWIVTVTLP